MRHLPETPTLFLEHGLDPIAWRKLIDDPASDDQLVVQIVALRVALEERFAEVARLAGKDVLLCDRGPADAAPYRNDGAAGYAALTGRALEDDLARYDIVLHLAPLNAPRKWSDPEDAQRAKLDRALSILWQGRCGYFYLPSDVLDVRLHRALALIGIKG